MKDDLGIDISELKEKEEFNEEIVEDLEDTNEETIEKSEVSEEVKEEKIEATEEKEEEKKEEVKEDKKDNKPKRKLSKKDKIIIGVVLVLIVIAGVVACLLLNKKEDKGTKADVVEVANYDVITYDSEGKLESLSDKYIVEYGDKQNKILNKNAEVLYVEDKNDDEEVYFELGQNDKVYKVTSTVKTVTNKKEVECFVDPNEENNEENNDSEELENKPAEEKKCYDEEQIDEVTRVIYEIDLNKGEAKKITDVVDRGSSDIKPVYNKTLKEGYRFIGLSSNSENGKIIYTVDGKTINTKYDELYGTEFIAGTQEEIDADNGNLIYTNEVGQKYYQGIYNYEKDKVVVKADYQDINMRILKNENYAALKNDKYGAISKTGAKVLDFDYELLFGTGKHIVAVKDSKIAILTNDYKKITDHIFKYQKRSKDDFYAEFYCCGGGFNNLETYELNSGLLLVINNEDDYYSFSKKDINGANKSLKSPYAIHEAYLIKDDGTYKRVTEYGIGLIGDLIYTRDKTGKIFTFYDHELNKKFDITVSSSDYNLNEFFEGAILLENKDKLYYSLIDGKPTTVDKVEYVYNVNDDIVVKGKDIYSIYVKDKEVSKIEKDYYSKENIEKSDNEIIYIGEKNYIRIIKK